MKTILHAFAKWFGSAAGVIQTFFLVSLVVIFEFVKPTMDPSGFWLLYWLTIYSSVTQPLLAYTSGVTDEANAEALKFIRYLSEQIDQRTQRIEEDVDHEHES